MDDERNKDSGKGRCIEKVSTTDRFRHVKVLWACLEIFCFGGLENGWSSLIYILKDEGVFEDLCLRHDQNITSVMSTTSQSNVMSSGCPDQDLRLNLLYTIGTGSALLFHLAGGQIFSRYGTRVVRCIYICVFWAGCLMIAFTSPDLPWLICPGMLFITGGSLIILTTSTQLSNLYRSGSIVVLGLMNGVMDSSSVVQLFVKLAHEVGFNRKYSYFIIALASVSVVISTFIIFPKGFVLKESEVDGFNESRTFREGATVLNCDAGIRNKAETVKDSFGKVRAMSFRKFVLNRIFIPHCLWFGIMMLHFTFFIGTINSYLNVLVDSHKPTVSYFTDVLSYTTLCGLIPSVAAGLFYDRQKKKYADSKDPVTHKIMPAIGPMVVATTLMLLLAILMMIPHTWILYLAFVNFTVFRAFLFCVSMSFLSDVFPTPAFGILYTIMLTQSSITYYVEYGLYDWWELYDGAMWHVKTFLLALSIVAFGHPLALWYHAKKHEVPMKQTTTTNCPKRSSYFASLYDERTIEKSDVWTITA